MQTKSESQVSVRQMIQKFDVYTKDWNLVNLFTKLRTLSKHTEILLHSQDLVFSWSGALGAAKVALVLMLILPDGVSCKRELFTGDVAGGGVEVL